MIPWAGGKAKVANVVWERFGLVDEYWEPFAGAAAVLLARPGGRRGREVVNDHYGLLANLHRTARFDPEGLIERLEVPVSALDMAAQAEVMRQVEGELRKKLSEDPEYQDTRLAAFFMTNVCGSLRTERHSAPHPVPRFRGSAGVYSMSNRENRGDLIRAISRRFDSVVLPCLDGRTLLREIKPKARIVTSVFVDHPYEGTARATYGAKDIGASPRRWAIANGNHPNMRIALCGRNLQMPDDWSVHRWKGHLGPGRDAEEVWFSPHCLRGGAS